MDFNNNMTTNELIEEVGQWATKNFGTVEEGRRIPHYGLLEEVGEATHAILKNRQKIRGYEVEEFFKKELQDAFADTIIYLADYAYIHRAYFKFHMDKEKLEESVDFLRARNEELVISQVTQSISAIFNNASKTSEFSKEISAIHTMMVQRLCSDMEIWAAYHGFNLQDIVWMTWGKVSKRDWNKEKQTGGE